MILDDPVVVMCPGCGHEVISSSCCLYCGYNLRLLHKTCSCGQPLEHARHWYPSFDSAEKYLAYFCNCGFVSTSKEELREHLMLYADPVPESIPILQTPN